MKRPAQEAPGNGKEAMADRLRHFVTNKGWRFGRRTIFNEEMEDWKGPETNPAF